METENKTLTVVKTDNEIVENVRETMQSISQEIQSISRNSLEIKNQGGWDAFWKRSENIQSLAGFTNDMALLQQKTLNLLVLLLNGTVRMKTDYNEIIETIEVLSKEESDVKVLAYLLELKKSIKIISERNDFISDTFDSIENQIKSLHELNNKFQTITDSKFSKMDKHIGGIVNSMQKSIKENADNFDKVIAKVDEINKRGEELANENTKIKKYQKWHKKAIIVICVLMTILIIYEVIKNIMQ
jgi:methyl-accepting chemotaxis protein